MIIINLTITYYGKYIYIYTVFKNIPFLNFTSILQYSIFQIFLFEQGNYFKIRSKKIRFNLKEI